jgi:hypothetical protein
VQARFEEDGFDIDSSVQVCVYVCVCEREREREREPLVRAVKAHRRQHGPSALVHDKCISLSLRTHSVPRRLVV